MQHRDNYQTLRMEDVYQTVKIDFPVLREQLLDILKENERNVSKKIGNRAHARNSCLGVAKRRLPKPTDDSLTGFLQAPFLLLAVLIATRREALMSAVE